MEQYHVEQIRDASKSRCVLTGEERSASTRPRADDIPHQNGFNLLSSSFTIPLFHFSPYPSSHDMSQPSSPLSSWNRLMTHPHAPTALALLADLTFTIKDATVQHLEATYHLPTGQIILTVMVHSLPPLTLVSLMDSQ